MSLPNIYLFFFNDTATTEIYTLSTRRSSDLRLEEILQGPGLEELVSALIAEDEAERLASRSASSSAIDRKSTRLNSSHQIISYAVFCLKKKKAPPERTIRL